MEAEKLRMQQQQMAMQQPQQQANSGYNGGNMYVQQEGHGNPPPINPELAATNQKKEEKQPEVEPVMGQDAANEVFAWLSKLKMERYYKTFIDNGYDQLTAIGDIEKEDLKEMGVALGHIRILVAAAVTAPYLNKRVKLKSVSYESFVHEYSKPNKMKGGGMRCVLQHNDKEKREGTVWLFDMLDNGDTLSDFRLKHVKSGSFMRLMGAGKEVDTRSPWKDNQNGQLMLKRISKGVYYIKEIKQERYLRFDRERALGYNKMMCTDKPDKDCRIKLKLVD